MKVAIYCRLSEEDRNKQFETDDSESIQNQKSMLIQYSMEHGWDIYNIYSDDDYTGADRNRPEFKKLISDAKDHKFDIILCKTQSRFTRELELVEKYIHGLFPIWGVRFISVVDNADTANKGNKKSRQINGLINEWYLEDMSENIKSVLTSKRKSGYHIGSFALYGYLKDPNKKGHLIVDEEAAKVVKEIFTLFSQGYGKTAIARILNDRGIPNPTEYKQQQGLFYKNPRANNSTLWSYFAISDILSNETYIGNLVQGKYESVSYKTKEIRHKSKSEWYIVEGTHEPIISHDLWNRVQDLIAQKTKPYINGSIGIFAKKARCMYCGYTMCSCKNYNRHYLKCRSRYISTNSCKGSFISVEKLEKIVLFELNQLSQQYLNKNKVKQNIEINNNLNVQRKGVEIEIKDYHKKLNEYSKALQEIYLDKIKGIISENDYIVFSKNFISERERLEILIAKSEKEILNIDERLSNNYNHQKIIEQYTNLENLDRETVEKLVDFIYVGKREKGMKEAPVEIHWKF